MSRRIGLLIARFVVVAGMALTVLTALPQTATAIDFFGDACTKNPNAAACNGRQDTISGPHGLILRAAALLSLIASIAAVIMIIVAGIMFVTAGGDSSKVGNARKVVVYAVVGLVVIFLARTIVVFVVSSV